MTSLSFAYMIIWDSCKIFHNDDNDADGNKDDNSTIGALVPQGATNKL